MRQPRLLGCAHVSVRILGRLRLALQQASDEVQKSARIRLSWEWSVTAPSHPTSIALFPARRIFTTSGVHPRWTAKPYTPFRGAHAMEIRVIRMGFVQVRRSSASQKAKVLVDTGETSLRELGPQLRELGIGPRDIRQVVLTHLHTDPDQCPLLGVGAGT